MPCVVTGCPAVQRLLFNWVLVDNNCLMCHLGRAVAGCSLHDSARLFPPSTPGHIAHISNGIRQVAHHHARWHDNTDELCVCVCVHVGDGRASNSVLVCLLQSHPITGSKIYTIVVKTRATPVQPPCLHPTTCVPALRRTMTMI